MPGAGWSVRVPRALAVAAALAVLVGVATLAVRRGSLVGGAGAAEAARAGLLKLQFMPGADAEQTLEVDQALAWALQRARPGPAGIALARGEGGAIRWRVVFATGGEATVTADGELWSMRLPVPTDPGNELPAGLVRAFALTSLPEFVRDAAAWRPVVTQSWNEGPRRYYRVRFVGDAGGLPASWRRELEMEVVGPRVVSVRRTVFPLSTDLGVVNGRLNELDVLRQPGLIGLAIVFLGALLAGAEAHAFHERLAIGSGVLVAVLVVALGYGAGAARSTTVILALAAGAVVAVLPALTALPPGRPAVGPVIGAVSFLLASNIQVVVEGLGGWIPETRPFVEEPSAWRLLHRAWTPALVEEPLLRGVVPGLAAPVFGWWGGALLGAGIGALLHPLPADPLTAAFAAELAIQATMMIAARAGGVSAAVLARGTFEALARRPVFPDGTWFDVVALIGPLVGLGLLLWPRRAN
jgi:hypothetical protein